MNPQLSAFGMPLADITRAHDLGDAMDRLVDLALDQRAWREPRNTREAADSPTSGRPHHHE